jgi:hypothetical protein
VDDDRDRIISFKVNPELGRLLDALPNKSDFIRQAILTQFRAICPFCRGKGVVPRGLGEHYTGVFACHRHVRCAGCGAAEAIPDDAAAAAPHWVAFLRGGPFRCAACFARQDGQPDE